jgi:outer membrane protein assembly factor BamB
LWQDLVIMTYDTDHHSLTVGVDKTTGTERWRSDRTNRIVASQLLDGYATPMIFQRNGRAELVHQACKLLVGYEPASGTERWTFSHPGEQPVPSPVVSDDLVIVLGGKYAPYLGAVRVDSKEEREVATEVWSGSKGLSDLSSPVVYGGYVYMVNKMGIACCLDAKSGRYQWQRRLRGAFWSSVTAADGKVYFSNASGTTTVIAAGPEYQVLSVNKLGEDVRTSLAVSGGAIFVRTREHLIRIGPEDSHAARHEPRE